jgi:hypothetical protein
MGQGIAVLTGISVSHLVAIAVITAPIVVANTTVHGATALKLSVSDI